MKPFGLSTCFESNTEYRFGGDVLAVELADTVRLTHPIYRAMYPSSKTWLDTAIYLKGLSNVTLDFGGATLLLRDDSIQPFVLDECENVTLKNVTVEYTRCLMDEIDVEKALDGEIWLRQTEKQKAHFPMRVENGSLIPIFGEKEYPNAFAEPHFFNLYNKETHECCAMYLVRIGKDLPAISSEQFPFRYYEWCAEQRGDYIVLRGDVPSKVVPNVTSSQTHADRDLNSVFILRSKNTRLESFRVLNGAGMGILGMYSENITLDRLLLFCDERSHGIATNAADAIHLISCFGKVEMLNCVLEGMKDDALNIHGNYYLVDRAEKGVIHAKIGTDVQSHPGVSAHYKMFDAGDTIAVYRGVTTEEKTKLTVERVEVTGDFSADLFVRGDTSALLFGDTVENLSAQADLTIRNCRFGKARTHLRLQTRGKILMENSECSLKVCLTGDKDYWFEGSPVCDLTIQNCKFTGEKGAILACPSFESTEKSPYYHSGIRVLKNSFEAAEAMELSHCRDVLFAENVNALEKDFENRYHGCAEVVEQR